MINALHKRHDYRAKYRPRALRNGPGLMRGLRPELIFTSGSAIRFDLDSAKTGQQSPGYWLWVRLTDTPLRVESGWNWSRGCLEISLKLNILCRKPFKCKKAKFPSLPWRSWPLHSLLQYSFWPCLSLIRNLRCRPSLITMLKSWRPSLVMLRRRHHRRPLRTPNSVPDEGKHRSPWPPHPRPRTREDSCLLLPGASRQVAMPDLWGQRLLRMRTMVTKNRQRRARLRGSGRSVFLLPTVHRPKF